MPTGQGVCILASWNLKCRAHTPQLASWVLHRLLHRPFRAASRQQCELLAFQWVALMIVSARRMAHWGGLVRNPTLWLRDPVVWLSRADSFSAAGEPKVGSGAPLMAMIVRCPLARFLGQVLGQLAAARAFFAAALTGAGGVEILYATKGLPIAWLPNEAPATRPCHKPRTGRCDRCSLADSSVVFLESARSHEFSAC